MLLLCVCSAAGTFPQIQAVLDSGVLLQIVKLATSSSPGSAPGPGPVTGGKRTKGSRGVVAKSGAGGSGGSALRVDAEVRSEASWVVLNASSCGSDAQIEQLVDYG